MKTMRYSLLILLLSSTLMVSAQDKRPMKENVEAMKIGFITERLQLTPEEAQKFWPVYNQYTDETDKLRMSRHKNMKEARENMEEMSEADAEKFVDNELAMRQEELDILKKYHPQFKKVLSSKKVARLYRTEEDFKRKLLEMLQDRKDGKKPGMDHRRP